MKVKSRRSGTVRSMEKRYSRVSVKVASSSRKVAMLEAAELASSAVSPWPRTLAIEPVASRADSMSTRNSSAMVEASR
ncbi:MAG: hypothetical protein P8J87_19160 [Verrucomicrobiales bacterium]|nr:hypothetical protein [Verrucomicrobiales bacterium]